MEFSLCQTKNLCPKVFGEKKLWCKDMWSLKIFGAKQTFARFCLIPIWSKIMLGPKKIGGKKS